MNRIVDARGLSCPQPVLATLKEIGKPGPGEVTVLVDTDTSRENVCRAAASKGWQVKTVSPEGTEYRITLGRNS